MSSTTNRVRSSTHNEWVTEEQTVHTGEEHCLKPPDRLH